MASQSKKFRFAMVSHSIEVVNIVRKCLHADAEDLFATLVGLDDAVATAEKLIADGYEVILGHGGTGGLIARSIGHPVVNIPTSMLEITMALMKAVELGKKIAVTSYAVPREGFEVLQNLFATELRQIVFDNHAQLETGVKDAIADGVEVIVGGGVSRNIASRLNATAVIIEPSGQSVQEALSQARAMAAVRRREIEHHERLRTMLQIMNDGVLCIDACGRLNFYNQTAESMLGVELSPLQGRPLTGGAHALGLMDVLASGEARIENIIKINENEIVISSMPILIGGKVRGAVALLKAASAIRNIDRKLRERTYRKGLFAKYTFSDLSGTNARMQMLIDKGQQYSRSQGAVLIAGETGTGKELLAHAVHNHSPRQKAPFVAVNCAALPETLLESELFGYEEGAFSGAKKGGKVGLFELANHGTIFLDEIGDIAANTQVRLLRVLESKEVMRVGGDRIVPVDVRIISSTHKDLRREVERGRFRADLYFRLAVLRLSLPPLRRRMEDIPLLVAGLLKRYHKTAACLTDGMLAQVQSYHWPGNIRELNSLIESYLILLGDRESDTQLFIDLFEEYRSAPAPAMQDAWPEIPAPPYPPAVQNPGTLKAQLNRHRQRIIRRTLKACDHNRSLAARQLGISTNTLWRALKGGG